jgi:hypothetical protein
MTASSARRTPSRRRAGCELRAAEVCSASAESGIPSAHFAIDLTLIDCGVTLVSCFVTNARGVYPFVVGWFRRSTVTASV